MTRDLVYGRNAGREALRGRREVLEIWAGERAASTLDWLAEGPRAHVRRERELTEAADGRIEHFERAGLVSLAFLAATVLLVRRIRIVDQSATPRPPTPESGVAD